MSSTACWGASGDNYPFPCGSPVPARITARWHGVIDAMEVEWQGARQRSTAMPRSMESSAKRPRISVDVVPDVRRRLRLAAARRDVSVRQYVVEAIEERLREDLGDEGEELLALNARADPLLAELWDNRKDAAYDRLRSR